MLFVLVLALLGGALIYQRWEHQQLRDQAQTAIADATQLTRQIEARDDFQQVRNENFAAWEDLESARAEFAAERYRSALDRARSSLEELHRLLQIESGENVGAGSRFVSVQGGVEFRRGGGAWRRARPGDTLRPGDWVKTSAGGTAELRGPDGSKVVLRRNTMIHFEPESSAASGPVTELAFGRVDLNTTASGGTVTTPKSEANVRSSSEASVSFDRDEGTGQFSAYSGGIDVVAENGQRQRVAALQQVEQVGDLLMEPVSLPDKPRLVSPGHESQINFVPGSEINLRWRASGRAARYALMVSRAPLFASSIIETEDLRRNSARLRVRGEGVFYWQVAGISNNGARGPWSDTQQFRIAEVGGSGEDDTTPPALAIEKIQTFGKLVLVTGQTERGASVRVNGEAVTVQVDGSFHKTIEVNQVGFAFLEVVASDAQQNPTEIKRRVFIDAF